MFKFEPKFDFFCSNLNIWGSNFSYIFLGFSLYFEPFELFDKKCSNLNFKFVFFFCKKNCKKKVQISKKIRKNRKTRSNLNFPTSKKFKFPNSKSFKFELPKKAKSSNCSNLQIRMFKFECSNLNFFVRMFKFELFWLIFL